MFGVDLLNKVLDKASGFPGQSTRTKYGIKFEHCSSELRLSPISKGVRCQELRHSPNSQNGRCQRPTDRPLEIYPATIIPKYIASRAPDVAQLPQ